MSRRSNQDELRRLAARLLDQEPIDRLKKKLPTKEDLGKLKERLAGGDDLARLQECLPTQDDLKRLRDKLPRADDVRRRLDLAGRWQRVRPGWWHLGWLALLPLRLIAWAIGSIPLGLRLGTATVLAAWLIAPWWLSGTSPTDTAPQIAQASVASNLSVVRKGEPQEPERQPEPKVHSEPKPERKQPSLFLWKPTFKPTPKHEPKYVINSGLYRQRLASGASPRYLLVKRNGQGQLILYFNLIEQIFIGAEKVVIETSWVVDEANAETTFTLNGGVPQNAYRNLLNGPLDKVTRFRIKDFQPDSLILQQTTDGEIFHWEKTSQ